MVLQTPEIGLDGAWLVRELSQGLEAYIGRIEAVTDIRVDPRSAAVEAVEVVLPQGTRLTLQPKALVLAAGAGNQALLEQATHGHTAWHALAREAQQIRKAHMLVVRGDRDDLPPFTGVFPSYVGLFIVSRDLGRETVWLISDNRSQGMVNSASWVEYDARWWLQKVCQRCRRSRRASSHNQNVYGGVSMRRPKLRDTEMASSQARNALCNVACGTSGPCGPPS